MERLAPLPIPSSRLERYRVRLQHRNRGDFPGAHLVRRRGQSLEFRELRPYVPGDDIRHVDWRASARHGARTELMVRAFELEAQTRLVISVDTRESMRLPAAAPKLQVALWLAEALAYVAMRSGDRVAVHNLFTHAPAASVSELTGPAGRAQIRRALRPLSRVLTMPEPLCLAPLKHALPPASIWLILTDLYLEPEELDRIARRIREAQDGARWVILVDFDSWPFERSLLGEGLRRVVGPGPQRVDPRLEVNQRAIEQVEAKIAARKATFDRAARAGGYNRVHWQWPLGSRLSLADFFETRFFSDPIIQRILMKDE